MAQLPGRIRELRRERNLTHEGLAFASQLSVSTVQRTEAGSHQPSLRTLTRLAEGLGVPVHALFAENAKQAS